MCLLSCNCIALLLLAGPCSVYYFYYGGPAIPFQWTSRGYIIMIVALFSAVQNVTFVWLLPLYTIHLLSWLVWSCIGRTLILSFVVFYVHVHCTYISTIVGVFIDAFIHCCSQGGRWALGGPAQGSQCLPSTLSSIHCAAQDKLSTVHWSETRINIRSIKCYRERTRGQKAI